MKKRYFASWQSMAMNRPSKIPENTAKSVRYRSRTPITSGPPPLTAHRLLLTVEMPSPPTAGRRSHGGLAGPCAILSVAAASIGYRNA